MDETLQQLGKRMREARTSLGLTLRQLAARTGLSASMLCHIEKGQANPTTQSLATIADALHCLPGSLFTQAEQKDEKASTAPCWMVLPAALRSWHELDQGVRVSPLAPSPSTGANFVEIVYPPGSSSGGKPFRHTGREWGLVLEGELTVDLPDGRIVLRPGDSIVFDSQIAHRFSNLGDAPMRAVWANFCTPPQGASSPHGPVRR